MPRLLVPFSLLFVVSLAVAQVPLSPLTLAPSRTPAYRPRLSTASSGGSFFLTWEERLFDAWPSTSQSVYRTYDSTGAPQQAAPLSLPGRNSPSVVWNGSEWFVVWADYLSQFQQFALPMIKGSRFTETGEAIDKPPVTLISSFSTSNAKVVWSGSNYLVGASGSVLAGSDGRPIRNFAVDYWPLASAGGTFLILGEGFVQVIAGDGTPIAIVPLERGGRLAASAQGDEYALVSAFSDSVKMLTVSARGEVTARYDVSASNTHGVDVTWSGDSFLASWSMADQHLCFSRFTRSAAPASQRRADSQSARSDWRVGPTSVDCHATSGVVSEIALAAGNERTLISWIERSNDVDRVYTAFVAPAGMPNITGATVASVAVQPQEYPAIELDPDGYAVVWNEPDDLPRAMIGRVDRSFAARPARSLAAPAPARVRLARGKDATLAVWASEGDTPQVFAQRIADNSGIVSPILLGAGHAPAVAFDGENWLAVWESADSAGQILWSVVTGSGNSLGAARVSPSDGQQTLPVVSSRGTDFLVAWIETPPGLRPQLRAIGVGRAGQPNGSVMTLADSQYFTTLDLAASGRQYLLVALTLENNIGLPVTSIIPDILVAGMPGPYGPLRVRPRAGGGFIILSGSPLHETTIDRDGNAFDGGTLPIAADSVDFVVDRDRLIVAYSRGRAFVDVFGGRERAVRHR